MELILHSDYEKIVAPIRAKAKIISETSTPKNKTKERPGKGGGMWTYAKSDYFEDCLNKDFPGWSLETTEHGIVGPSLFEEAFAIVKLSVIDNGLPRIITRTGGAEIKYLTEKDPQGGKHKTTNPLSIVNDKKAAETDGFKRCCYVLGYARDLRVDPADVDVTEEQFGLVMKSIENASDKFKHQISELLKTSVNATNYDKFVINKIMPVLKSKDPENYNMLAKIYGDLIE